jgi:hypothetical protein
MVKVALAALVAVAALVALPAASAKDFKPGDIRICNADHCKAVVNRKVLALLAAFYYDDRSARFGHRDRVSDSPTTSCDIPTATSRGSSRPGVSTAS